MQVHRLCGRVPSGLLLRGREHARHLPDECIDCGVCEPECPVDAIKPDSDIAEKWIKLNAEYAVIWPNIARKKAAPLDADEWRDKTDKFVHFSAAPGKK